MAHYRRQVSKTAEIRGGWAAFNAAFKLFRSNVMAKSDEAVAPNGKGVSM